MAMLSHFWKVLVQKHTAMSPLQLPWNGGTSGMFRSLQGDA